MLETDASVDDLSCHVFSFFVEVNEVKDKVAVACLNEYLQYKLCS
jgi:hypothetical protein